LAITNKLPFLTENAVVMTGTNILYWIKWPDGYSESFTNRSGNTTTALVIVDWEDSADFKNYAMGFTNAIRGASTFERFTPLRNPYAPKQYLVACDLVEQYMTQDQREEMALASPDPYSLPWAPDPVYYNWPKGGWACYQLTFSTMPYPILRDEDLPAAGSGVIQELSRYVRKTFRSIPKERKTPTFGYETCEVTPTIVAEAGFVPIVETEIVYTLFQVPNDLVPLTAISACSGRCNSVVFDGKAVETMLFRGLAAPIEPYGGPSGELYCDLMYTMSLSPSTNGWNYVPVGTDTGSPPALVYKRVRETGSASGTSPGKPLYSSVDFSGLFKPEA
jgi:hypothetical protein